MKNSIWRSDKYGIVMVRYAKGDEVCLNDVNISPMPMAYFLDNFAFVKQHEAYYDFQIEQQRSIYYKSLDYALSDSSPISMARVALNLDRFLGLIYAQNYTRPTPFSH